MATAKSPSRASLARAAANELAAKHALTPRQTHVLTLVARGVPRSELAGHVGVAENSMKTFVRGVLRKVGEPHLDAVRVRLLEEMLRTVGVRGK